MAKKLPGQHKGGRLPGGEPNKSGDPKVPSNWAVKRSTKAIIAKIPQVSSGEWSQSYLVEQVLLNWLGQPTDYDSVDLDLVKAGRIVT